MSQPHVDLSFPLGALLRPVLRLRVELGGGLGPLEVQPSLAHVYAWVDAGDRPPAEALLPAQVAALALLKDEWPILEQALATHYPPELHPFLRWAGVTVTDREKDGLVYVQLSGHVDAPFPTEHDEHGIGAVLLGTEVVVAGERDPIAGMPVDRPRLTELRPHPDYVARSDDALREMIARGDTKAQNAVMQASEDWLRVDAAVLAHLFELPAAEAVAQVPRLRPYLIRNPQPIDADLAVQRDPTVLRALIDAGRFRLPQEALANATDPAEFEAYLALGADVATLYDDEGYLVIRLSDGQREVLRRLRPGLLDEPEVPDARTGRDVLTVWLSQGWLELSDDADPDQVGQALAGLLALAQSPATLLEVLLRVPGIDELFIDDETLQAVLDARS